jgi:hypothetical protein
VIRFWDQSTRMNFRAYQGLSLVFSTTTFSGSPVCGL